MWLGGDRDKTTPIIYFGELIDGGENGRTYKVARNYADEHANIDNSTSNLVVKDDSRVAERLSLNMQKLY